MQAAAGQARSVETETGDFVTLCGIRCNAPRPEEPDGLLPVSAG